MGKAVVLSDVHIGTNQVTNWYQKKYHEPYLVSALDWVTSNASAVDTLLLLGDLVDFWTYEPSVTPPSMSDIIAANPNVLGPGGALSKAAEAVSKHGKVTLMRGNHDINLGPDDANALSTAIGVPIDFVSGAQEATNFGSIALGGTKGHSARFMHGHYFTLFNAPDTTKPLSLPVGHFVTRIIAWKQVHRLLQPGQTVADLSLWGQPSPSLDPVIDAVLKGYVNVAGVLIDLFAQDAQLPDGDDTAVVLPGGASITLGQAKVEYQNLLADWLAKWPLEDVVRAGMADYKGDVYLAWFAQWLALTYGNDLVVAGHTHQPLGGLKVSPVNYVNNGYECAAIPDLTSGEAHFTFTTVDLDLAQPTMYKVAPDGNGGYPVSQFQAPLSGIVHEDLSDFSCYIHLTNRSGEQLTVNPPLVEPGAGRWVRKPPSILADQTATWVWLQDTLGAYGTEGFFTYNGNLRYDFACPTRVGIFTDNAAGGPGRDFVARAGATDATKWDSWQAKGAVPKAGHPLQVEFTLLPADADPNFTGRCGQDSSAVSALGLQPGSPLKLNGSTDLHTCVQGVSGACVYSITLTQGSYDAGLFAYRLSIDGQGPAGAGTLYLAFTDQEGDVYHTYFWVRTRQIITKDYNSKSPAIVRVQWSNSYV